MFESVSLKETKGAMMHKQAWIGQAKTMVHVLGGLALLLVLGCAEERRPIPAIPATPTTPGMQAPSMQSQSQGSLGAYQNCDRNILIRCAPGTWVINYDCPKNTPCPGRATVVIGADGNLVRVEEVPSQYQLHGFGIYEDEFSSNMPKETFLKINITSAPVDPKNPYVYSVGSFKGLQKGDHWEGHLNAPGPNDTWINLWATATQK
jgi:hypothetical protein